MSNNYFDPKEHEYDPALAARVSARFWITIILFVVSGLMMVFARLAI